MPELMGLGKNCSSKINKATSFTNNLTIKTSKRHSMLLNRFSEDRPIDENG